MAKEICISSTPHETRLAILEDDQLAEIYYERENEYTLAGSIYKGRVTRVLPGMQSAFVDLGLERDAFLYVTDFLEEQEEDSDEFERVEGSGSSNRRPREQGEPREGRETREGREPREGREARQPREGREAREPRESREPREARESRPRSIEIEGGLQASESSRPQRESRGDQGEGESGVRRWQGRRGRRMRGRGPRTERPLESPDVVEEAITAEPVALPERGAPGGIAAQHLPIVLPGESLSKYGGRPAESKPAASAAPSRPAHSASTSRPSTLVDVPTGWDGGLVLPGESLSRRRGPEPVTSSPQSWAHDPAPVSAELVFAATPAEVAEAAPVEEAAPEVPGHATPEAQDLEVGGASASAPFQSEPEHQAEHDVQPAAEMEPLTSLAAAAAVPEDVQQPETEHAAEHENGHEIGHEAEHEIGHEIVEETHEYEPEEASASYRVETPRSELRFSLPAEDEHTEEEQHQQEAAGQPAHEDHQQEAAHTHELEAAEHHEEAAHETHPEAHQEAHAENQSISPEAEVMRQLFGYAPGMGVLEEETIDEDEYDFEPIPGEADEHAVEDLEEETLDQAATVGDTVRDVHIEKRLGYGTPAEASEEEETSDLEIGEVDDEFEDSSAEEDDFAEPSSETGEERTVEARPQRREGGRRLDRRGGGGGRGRQPGRRHNGRRPNMQTMDIPIISELLKQGQEILVQIAKEPIARKGARITSHIALPGRFLVFMPTVNHVGVSRKIDSDEERQRLKRILISEKGDASGGFIVRTAAEHASEDDLRADIRFLINLWAEIKQRSDNAKAPALIYHDLNLVERILRDQVSDNFSTIWVDNEVEYERIVRFLNRFQPSLVRRVKLYTKETPLFEQFGIQEEISKALKSKVWLKSGGSIVINQTEALVAIDINTGKYVGKTARLEDTILKTNLDAIPEIVRQIRLRDLGGIIVIDFIDMDERRNRQKVTQALEDALKADRAPSKVLQFNDFGLVAITRKRVKQSLERTLSVPCPICTGTGMVKSPITVANEIYIEMRKMMRHLDRGDVLLRVHPDVVKVLKAGNAKWLNELEEMIGKTILVKSDPALPPEQFDIQG